MQDEILVKVEGVSKKFCRDLKRSLWYGVKDISSELFGVSKNGQLRTKEFWAVDDVSFRIADQEIISLVGQSGCGKTVLAKMLLRLEEPTSGELLFNGEPIGLTKTPHEPPRWMKVPIEFLVVLVIAVGVAPAYTVGPILDVVAGSRLKTLFDR